MNIEKLLEYQSIDAELIKTEGEFRALPVCKEYFAAANSYKEAQNSVLKLNGEAEEMVKQIEGLSEQYKKLSAQLDDAEKSIDRIAEIKEADYYTRNVEKILADMQSLGKLISALSSKIEDHRKNYEKALKQGKEAKLKGMDITPQYQAAREEIKPVIEGFNSKLAAIEQTIAAKDLEHYKQLRSAKKFPAIVPLHGEASCGGCFMEMAGNAVAKLKADGYIECPNCSRILYVK